MKHDKGNRLPFGGLAAVTIPECRAVPPLDAALSRWGRALVIRRFLPFGGENTKPTPVEARLLWSGTGLHVAFRCTESNPRYRPLQDKSGTGLSNPVFADMVAVQVRPSWNRTGWLQVAVASAGRIHAERFPSWPLPADGKAKSVKDIRHEVRRDRGVWLARVTVPWAAMGGRPTDRFGLNLLRVRGQSAERVSPVALDFSGEPAPDLFMDAELAACGSAQSLRGALVRMPSGARRWQRPARLAWPMSAERAALWRQQEQLSQPTTEARLAARLHLAQRLQDILILEGCSYHPQGGSWFVKPGDYQPEQARSLVNEALRKGDVAGACGVLDHFLGQLDRAVRFWFADESPGNVRFSEWTPLDSVSAVACRRDQLVIRGRAGARPVELVLSRPGRTGFACTRRPAGSSGRRNVGRYVAAGPAAG